MTSCYLEMLFSTNTHGIHVAEVPSYLSAFIVVEPYDLLLSPFRSTSNIFKGLSTTTSVKFPITAPLIESSETIRKFLEAYVYEVKLTMLYKSDNHKPYECPHRSFSKQIINLLIIYFHISNLQSVL